jgi:peptidoglycan-associated lipoprotein
MHRILTRVAAVVSATMVLAACEGTFGTQEEEQQAVTEPAPIVTAAAESAAGGATSGIGTQTGFQGHPLDDPASLLSNRTVYFEFDSSEIQTQDRAVIEAHAGYLAGNAGASVTLEGHADERGTREYNIALGERRANSVRQLMTLIGASAQQVRTISYGEERAVAEGHDEAAWSLNRRVEVIYRTR